MARKKFKIPGVSFSWKRALGVTSAKRKISKITGIPTTKSGRQRKLARTMGCMTFLLMGPLAATILVLFLI